MSVVHAYYYTDPACPWSWALEPVFRRLCLELGDSLQVEYVMCGMAREFGDPVAIVRELLAAGHDSGMPVDARLWLETPPHSSYPACIAIKAAAEQGVAAGYLRRLREGIMCRGRKLDVGEALVQEARATPGLDVERFRLALASHATLEAFGADMDRAAAVPAEHHSEGSGRVKLPSLEFSGQDGSVHGVYGFSDYGELSQAAVDVGASRSDAPAPSVEEALRRFGTMAVAEVAEVCRLPGPRAPAELWRLATEWRVKSERVGNGELWALA
jgi:predicted DsbA family dithiol-disulfide isomerase